MIEMYEYEYAMAEQKMAVTTTHKQLLAADSKNKKTRFPDEPEARERSDRS
jgi:hypothetical protein